MELVTWVSPWSTNSNQRQKRKSDYSFKKYERLKMFFALFVVSLVSVNSSWSHDRGKNGFAYKNYFTMLGILPSEDISAFLGREGTKSIVDVAVEFWANLYFVNQDKLKDEDSLTVKRVNEAYRYLRDPKFLEAYIEARFKETVEQNRPIPPLLVGPEEFFGFVEARTSELKRGFYAPEAWVQLSIMITSLDQGIELELRSKNQDPSTRVLLEEMRFDLEKLRGVMLESLFATTSDLKTLMKHMRNGRFRTRLETNLVFILNKIFSYEPGGKGLKTLEQLFEAQSYLRNIILDPDETKHLDLAMAYFLLTRDKELEGFLDALSFEDLLKLRYFLSGRKGHLVFLRQAAKKAKNSEQIFLALAKHPNRFSSWKNDFENWPFYKTALKADTPKNEYPQEMKAALDEIRATFFKLQPNEKEIEIFNYLSGATTISPETSFLPGECARVLGRLK